MQTTMTYGPSYARQALLVRIQFCRIRRPDNSEIGFKRSKAVAVPLPGLNAYLCAPRCSFTLFNSRNFIPCYVLP